MAYFSGDIEFDVVCDVCGNTLSTTEKTNHNGHHTLHVTPCEKCLEKTKDEADSDGYERGCDETLADFRDKVRETIRVIDEEKEKHDAGTGTS